MKSSEFNEKLVNSWNQLQQKIVNDEDFKTAGKAKIKVIENFWFFIDLNETPGIEIISKENINIKLEKLIESKSWKIQIEKNIFRMVLKNFDYSDFFKKIINLIITNIYIKNYKQEESIKYFLDHLIEAKNFFEDDKKIQHLTKESEIGLIGELIVLKNFFLEKFDYEFALKSWTGSYKQHDFETDNYLMEVKTTTSLNSKIINTSSNDQLSPIFDKKLYLAFININKQAKGKNLNDYIGELKNIFKNQSELLLNDFLLKIIKYGYHEKDKDKYKTNFGIISTEFYKIDTNFPYIKNIQIPNEISDVQINYKLDLGLCKEFILEDKNII